MRETEAELDQLQALLDASHARAGAHLASIADDSRRLTARQVATHLQGMRHIILATVSRDGRPFAAPLDAFFLHGRWVTSTGAEAQRVRHIRNNPNVSAVRLEGDDFAFTVHGTATTLAEDDPAYAEYVGVFAKWYDFEPSTLGAIAVFRIDPVFASTFALNPENYPE